MKQTKSTADKSLEAFKVFPYVAWGLTVIFAFFVYNITMELKAVTTQLQAQTKSLEEKINTPISEVADFKR